MQSELDAADLPVAVRILGVNGIGFESANATITAGRTLPWLQDVAGQDVWDRWEVTYRDVILLDADNVPIGVYNLTTNDLGEPAKYAALKQMIEQAAGLARR